MTDDKVLSLLQMIDLGYRPDRQEQFAMKKVMKLVLHGPQISSLPKSIGQLRTLQFLDLEDANITALPESIGQLTALQRLNLRNTNISVLPESLGQLSALERLDLSFTKITTLPESIGHLFALEILDLSFTKISELPESIGQLHALKSLRLGSTPITSLPESIGQLRALENLRLWSTNLSTLPDSIGQIRCLKLLDICFTEIATIPESLALRLSIKRSKNHSIYSIGILAEGTQLPPEYFAGKEVLQRYFEAQRTHQQQTFRESKIIFLGDGGAGKTYTINRMLKGGEPEPEPDTYSKSQTHGVKPYEYSYQKDGDDFTIHLWDFGGQELFHAMHRCFLSYNTVYVLMVSSRGCEHTRRLRYWLNSIREYVGETEVRVIANIYDGKGKVDIDEASLRSEFGELKILFQYFSVKNVSKETFLKEVTKPLTSLAEQAELAAGLHPIPYMRVKDEVKNRLNEKPHTIMQSDFENLCRNEGLPEREAEALLDYFTQLGVCFRGDDLISYRLLQPVWITNALYAIIVEGQSDKGVVKRTDIVDVLTHSQRVDVPADYTRIEPGYTYEPADCDYILQVALKHKLAYHDPYTTEEIFFPAKCLMKDRPAPICVPEDAKYPLTWELRYMHLPETTVQELMVDCLLEGWKLPLCWRGGFQMKVGFIEGIVDTVDDGRAVRIELWSKEMQAPIRPAFEQLRHFLDLRTTRARKPREYLIKDGEEFSIKRLQNYETRGLLMAAGDDGPAIAVRDLLGSFPLHQRETPYETANPWYRFQVKNSNPKDAFEGSFCYELFCESFLEAHQYPSMPRNYVGVETVPVFSNKLNCWVSYQSKFFEHSGASQYRQIKDSLEKAPAQFGSDKTPGKIFLYCNRDMNEDDASIVACKELLKQHGIDLVCYFGNALWHEVKEHHLKLVKEYFEL